MKPDAPEARFLLAMLKDFLGTAGSWADAMAATAGAGIDWDRWLDLVRHNQLVPIVYWMLQRRGGLKLLPQSVATRLRALDLETAAALLHRYAALPPLIRALERQALPFVILKGAALAQELYQPRELRPFADIDLLVPRDRYPAAKAVLIEEGFEVAAPWREAIRRAYFNSVEFVRRRGPQPLALDLHWDSLQVSWNEAGLLQRSEVWASRRRLDLGECRLPVLGLETELIHLCVHLSLHHQFGRLGSLVDIARFIQVHGGALDWHKVAERAARYHLVRPVWTSLALTARLLGVAAPLVGAKWPVKPWWLAGVSLLQPLALRTRPVGLALERALKYALIDDPREALGSLRTFQRQRRATARAAAVTRSP